MGGFSDMSCRVEDKAVSSLFLLPAYVAVDRVVETK